MTDPPPKRRLDERFRQRRDRVVDFAKRDLWLLEVTALPRLQAFLTRTLRVLLLTVRGFLRDRCLQQAAALTYGTIFSLPPVLAFAFAVSKGFNLYAKLKQEAIEPFLNSTFGARSDGAAPELRQAVDQIFTYVETTDLAALGGIALAFVMYSVLKLLGAVEGTLNEIYGVKRSRTLLRRVSDYLTIVVIAPVFLLTAMALTAFLESKGSAFLASETLQSTGVSAIGRSLLDLAGSMLPLLAVWFGLTFVYVTLPNTRVRVTSAVIGGVVAGSIWQAIQILHLQGQIELARYNAIYSSFAAIPMLLLWIYLSWSVFLIGAELAFAHQNEVAFTTLARTGKVDQDFQERIAPRLAGRIARLFLTGSKAPTAAELAGELGVAPRPVVQVLDTLVRANLLVRTSVGADDGFVPARDPETITVIHLLQALRREPDASAPPVKNKLDERVDRLLAALDEENKRSLHNYTLSELARTLGENAEEESAPGAESTRPAETTS